MKPIYEPKGAAKEYGDYALNIYTGCPHACVYCYSPKVLHRDVDDFKAHVEPRRNIVEETYKQLKRENITGKLIHLCFSCDPYPTGVDNEVTRSIIKALKDFGNHVQILTKGSGARDFDLLDENDWYGVTYAGYKFGTIDSTQSTEPGAIPPRDRLKDLWDAHDRGIKTWVSMEPVMSANDILNFLEINPVYIDKYKIGKLNYYPSDIDWSAFGEVAERICKANRMDYYIKDSLRKEMNNG